MPKKVKVGGEVRHLYEWAEDTFFVHDVSRFLSFCKKEGVSSIDLVSYGEFLILKEKFES